MRRAARELPWNKRWPGKPAFKISFLTPKASRIDAEFGTTLPVGKALQTVILAVVALGKQSPRFVELLVELAEQGRQDMERGTTDHGKVVFSEAITEEAEYAEHAKDVRAAKRKARKK